jgi:hypothetical protein
VGGDHLRHRHPGRDRSHHSSDTWQEADFGNNCRAHDNLNNGKQDCLHWLWGSNEIANVAHSPKIFYSY